MNRKDFKEQPVSKNNFLKQAVIGLSDGFIISFAVATALSVIYSDTYVIAKYTGFFSVLCAVILGIAGYLAAKFRMETLAVKTVQEEERLKNEETFKTVALFKKLGIGEDMQEQAATEIEKDSEEWRAFLKKNQQAFEIPDKKELPVTGLVIGLTFIIGAALALIAYFLWRNSREAMQLSICFNIPLLLSIGFIKSYINREPLLWGSFRLLLLGTTAAAAAWLVAGVFIK
ncbi:MAG: VIT1/CCC1 transporter family protein [Rhizobacter sp.]|nr:VIT1/CCC1 transporter family protein [Ferruginibacter sp.]